MEDKDVSARGPPPMYYSFLFSPALYHQPALNVSLPEVAPPRVHKGDAGKYFGGASV
jgi:hypothetical protein